jgi:hypothetical protein
MSSKSSISKECICIKIVLLIQPTFIVKYRSANFVYSDIALRILAKLLIVLGTLK